MRYMSYRIVSYQVVLYKQKQKSTNGEALEGLEAWDKSLRSTNKKAGKLLVFP